MKSVLFTAYTLDVGGIETALVDLLNELTKKYDVTLVLEKKHGELLNKLNPKIKIIEYKPNHSKNELKRRFINCLKRLRFIIIHKNKYDFAASFATYSKMASFCARTASKNNALWVHTDYLAFYNNEESEVQNFFNFINYKKFKNIIFVSHVAEINTKKVLKINNTQAINNLIDYKSILAQSNNNIELEKETGITTFLNISRHEEMSKKLSRIIEASEKLKQANYNFKILLIGEGKDTAFYKKLVHEKNLEDYVMFLGQKNNPYPYFKISDCFLLTSEFEGYPVVFNECRVLNVPIITTDVSDSKEDIMGNYGLVVNKDIDSIYNAMKSFINNGYIIKNKFNAEEYNNKIINKLEELINGGQNAQN